MIVDRNDDPIDVEERNLTILELRRKLEVRSRFLDVSLALNVSFFVSLISAVITKVVF